jgi:hypothetical protein
MEAKKLEILRRWEYDACEISVAEHEGMAAKDGKCESAPNSGPLLILHNPAGTSVRPRKPMPLASSP